MEFKCNVLQYVLRNRLANIMLPSSIFCVSEQEKKIIEKSHGKDEDEINKFVGELQEWIKSQPHIPQDQNDNNAKLLRKIAELNKFRMDKVKKKLDMFYAVRNIAPEFYQDRSPLNDDMQNLLRHFTMTPLPKLLNGQQRIYITRSSEDNSGDFDVLAFARYVFNIYDLRIHYDVAPEEILIADFQNVRLHHIIRMSPLFTMRLYSILEKGYSDRIKGIHLVNVPFFANILVTLFKYVLSFKLANRVYVHKDMESLNETISKDCLPSEYGGNLESIQKIQDDWQNFIESQDEWLVIQGNKKTNEDLRPESSKTPGMFNSLLQIFKESAKTNEAPIKNAN